MQSLREKYCSAQLGLPEKVRVSTGTAIVLGLLKGKLVVEPTTAYFMTYKEGKCLANCGFCPQARQSRSSTELLSRVSWPTFSTQNLVEALVKMVEQGKIKRVCIQALNYPQVFADLQAIVKEIKKLVSVPISVSCQPLTKENILLLSNAGADRIGIALDAATEALFENVKGRGVGSSYRWKNQFDLLSEAVGVFGKGNVSTHVIVGLGETEKEAAQIIQICTDLGVMPALFAFTPIRGTALENNPSPSVGSYRRVQLARYLIGKGLTRVDVMKFDVEGKILSFGLANHALESIIEGGEPFLTSGCRDCNRPFYNEKVTGPIYNYPRKLREEELEKEKQQFAFF